MEKSKLTAVILAGGKGTRLGHLTKGKLKPLITILGKPLFQYCITWAKYLGASKIIIVGSYKFDQLQESVRAFDNSIILIKDKVYMPGNRMLGLLAACDQIEGDMVLFDGDYIYHKSIANAIRKRIYNEVAVHATNEKSEYTAQDVIVRFDKDNNLLDIFKTKGTQELRSGEYYFNSLLYCPFSRLDDFFTSAENTMSQGGAHIEDAVLTYSREGRVVNVVNIGPPLWIEVDTLEELQAAKEFVIKHRNDIP